MNWKIWKTNGNTKWGRKKATAEENNDKSKKNGELCRTKMAGIAEKNGKTSCYEWKNMVKFPL